MNRFCWIPLLFLVSGCTGAEVRQTTKNLVDSAADVLSDPTKFLTPGGLLTAGGLVLLGFGSRQSASLVKWAGKKTAGPLVKLLTKKPQ